MSLLEEDMEVFSVASAVLRPTKPVLVRVLAVRLLVQMQAPVTRLRYARQMKRTMGNGIGRMCLLLPCSISQYMWHATSLSSTFHVTKWVIHHRLVRATNTHGI